nr:acyltransferase family protein [Blastococcus sp. TF02-8]
MTATGVTQERVTTTTPPTAPTGRGIRIEIQGLRALAVSLVVVYHVAPSRLPGGYVGVDVFFVVSGFLITGHLLREVARTGGIRLAEFWARRARRLLPAALLVLLASAVGTVVLAPVTYWPQFLRELSASAVYVENWALANDAVDYLAAANVASPAQHYWSLSTEEQFYLAWPLLLLAAGWLARRQRRRWQPAAVLLAAVAVASFLYSLWATEASPPYAYFSTLSRAWEFGLGGLLAVFAARTPATRDQLRAAVSWTGFLAITASALMMSEATAFPGTAALVPVLGTVAVIWAGAPRAAWAPTGLAGARPVAFLSDISYSAYLWHWPAVVLVPLAVGHPLGLRTKAGVLVFTVVAAWLTKRWVEDPVRSGGFLVRKRPRWTYAATVLCTGTVVLSCVGAAQWQEREVAEASAAAEAFAAGDDPCFGAAAMERDGQCSDRFAQTSTVSPAFAQTDGSRGLPCMQPEGDPVIKSCRFGSAHPTETVALVGDSHTASLYEALQVVAERRNWAVVTYVRGGCPTTADSDRMVGPNMQPGATEICQEYASEVLRTIERDPTISRVFTSYRSDIYAYRDTADELHREVPAEVLQGPLRALADSGKRVTVIRAVPTTNGVAPRETLRSTKTLVDPGVHVPNCIAAAGRADDPCAGPREVRLAPDYLAEAAEALGDPRIRVVDLSDGFCDAERCHTVIGGVIAYFDASHVSGAFSRSLGPLLDARL